MLVAAGPATLCSRRAPAPAGQQLSRRWTAWDIRHVPTTHLWVAAAAAQASAGASAAPPAAAAGTSPPTEATPSPPAAAAADGASSSSSSTELARPSIRHQPPLDKKFRRDRKAAAETLAREKRLPRVQVGAKGITQPVVDSCLDVLMKHELLRVKLGEGCGLDRDEATRLLEELLDAVAVHAVGFTVTLYRQQGLPRPSNYQGSGGGGGMTTSSSDEEDDAAGGGSSHSQQQQQQQQQRPSKPKAKAGSKQQKPAKKRMQKPPPPQEAKPPSIVVL